MAGRGPQSFKKRQKEQQRKEKQEEKRAKRLQRRQAGPQPEEETEPGVDDLTVADQVETGEPVEQTEQAHD